MRDVRAHYIRSNENARIPSRFIILDSESDRKRDKKGETQSWSLAVATFLTWNKKGVCETSTSRFETPMALWEACSDFTRTGRRTVLYAHNLNYDLRICQALSLLPKLGWQLRDMRLDGRGSWSKWSREKASLTLCDSASIFPVSLDILGKTLGIPKLPLPPCGQREKLFQRCERDVAILTDAISRYVTWLRTGECGNWQMTGASQAWSQWRHSHYTHKILVHDNADALAAERAAMHAGRCEAWRWGKYSKDVFYEYDWQNSYPRIARDSQLPTKLCGTVTAPGAKSMEALITKYCVLAELEITTTVPCVPASHDGRVLWPTGTFRSVLWDPEIRLLRESGASFRVRRAWLYKREPALKGWAEWILSSLHSKNSPCEPWKMLILKHWSRALIGRFGMRYRSWEHFATAPESRVFMSQLLDSSDGSLKELMQIGSDIFTSGELKEIDDGCPQITGYIMSEARAKLWRASQLIGPDHVFYMDTDSLLVDSSGHQKIQSRYDVGIFDGLRSKGRYRRMELYGPRAIVLDKRPSVSGLPKSATRMSGTAWQGDVWRGAMESVRRGEHDSVRIAHSIHRLRYNSHRRYFDADGRTRPYVLPGYVPAGSTVRRPSRREVLIANGYPAVLAYSGAKKSVPRPK